MGHSIADFICSANYRSWVISGIKPRPERTGNEQNGIEIIHHRSTPFAFLKIFRIDYGLFDLLRFGIVYIADISA